MDRDGNRDLDIGVDRDSNRDLDIGVDRDSKIYVAGHTGLVGSAVVRALKRRGYANLLTATHGELDLTDAAATRAWFEREKPDAVILAAAKVGGIGANAADNVGFLRENLAIALSVIEAARAVGVTKLINLGSSCIYPRDAAQPIVEEALLSGPLEPTNEGYALAKIAALKLCELSNRQYGTNFLSLMPTNLYGPGDTYDLDDSHVLPALIKRFDDAKTADQSSVTLWGDGSPLREFLYVDDLAGAVVFALEQVDTAHSLRFGAAEAADSDGSVDGNAPRADAATREPSWINVGSGEEVSIAALAALARAVVYADSDAPLPTIEWDTTRPNGMPRKLLDSARINALGWYATTPLRDGIERTYAAYQEAMRNTDSTQTSAASRESAHHEGTEHAAAASREER